MEEINKQIVAFLAQEELDYDAAVALYEAHTDANARQAQRYHKRRIGAHMHSHVVYSLEMLVGQKESGRTAVLGLNSVVRKNVPNLLKVTEAKVELEIEADEMFSKKIEDLSTDEQNLILKKRDLNNKLDIYRKELTATGEGNAPELVAKREHLIRNIETISKEIKEIWKKLNIDPEELLKETSEEDSSDDTPVDEFPPEYYKNKDDLKKLRDKLRKQKKSAEEAQKQTTREKAAKNAEETQALIDELEKWFTDNGFE